MYISEFFIVTGLFNLVLMINSKVCQLGSTYMWEGQNTF